MLAFGTLLLVWPLLQQGFGQNVSEVTTVNGTLVGTSSSTPTTVGITYPQQGSSCQDGDAGTLPLQWQQSDGLCCRCQDGIVECHDIAQLGCPVAPENTTGCFSIDVCGCNWWVCEGMIPSEYVYSNSDENLSIEDEDGMESAESSEEFSDEEEEEEDYEDWQGDGDDETDWGEGDQIFGNSYPGYPHWVRKRRSIPGDNGGQRFLPQRRRIARDEGSTVKNEGENGIGSEPRKVRKVPRPGKRQNGQGRPKPPRTARRQPKGVKKNQGNNSRNGKKKPGNPNNRRNGGGAKPGVRKNRPGKNKNNKRQNDKSLEDGKKDGTKGGKKRKPNGKANRKNIGKGTPQNKNAGVNRRNRQKTGMGMPPGIIRTRVKIMNGKPNNPRTPNGKKDRRNGKKNGKERRGQGGKQKKKKNKNSKNRKNERHGKSNNDKHKVVASAVASNTENDVTSNGEANQRKKQNNKSVFGGPTDDELDIFGNDPIYYSGDGDYTSDYNVWYNDMGLYDNSSYDDNYNYNDYYYNYNYDWFDFKYPSDLWQSSYDDYYNNDYSNYNYDYYDYSQGSMGYWGNPYGYDMEWYVPRSMWGYPNCNCNCGGEDRDDDDDDNDDGDSGNESDENEDDETEVSDSDVTVTTGIPTTTTITGSTASVDDATEETAKSTIV